MNRISRLLPLLAAPLLYGASANQPPGLLSDPVDISSDFHEFSNIHFLADCLATFDPVKKANTRSTHRCRSRSSLFR